MPGETNMSYPSQYEADVLTENEQMRSAISDYGSYIASELETGVYYVTFPSAWT